MFTKQLEEQEEEDPERWWGTTLGEELVLKMRKQAPKQRANSFRQITLCTPTLFTRILVLSFFSSFFAYGRLATKHKGYVVIRFSFYRSAFHLFSALLSMSKQQVRRVKLRVRAWRSRRMLEVCIILEHLRKRCDQLEHESRTSSEGNIKFKIS